jgi:hypothetical protein
MLVRLGLAMARQEMLARTTGRPKKIEIMPDADEFEPAGNTEMIMTEQEMNTMIRAVQETITYPVRLRPVGTARREGRPAARPGRPGNPPPIKRSSTKARTI